MNLSCPCVFAWCVSFPSNFWYLITSLNLPNIYLKIKGDSCNGKNWSQIIFSWRCLQWICNMLKKTEQILPINWSHFILNDCPLRIVLTAVGLRISLTLVTNNLLFNIQDTKSLWHLPSPFHSQTFTGVILAVIELANRFSFWNADCLIMMGKISFYSHKLR